MQRMHFDAEPLAEARERLRRQSDLGHEHERLSPARETVGDRLQIDLGLAAARDTFEQHRAEIVVRDDRLDRGALFVVERRPGRAIARDARGRRPDRFGQAFRRQRARGGAPAGQGVVEFVLAARALRQEHRQPMRHRIALELVERRAVDQPPHELVGLRQRPALAQGRRQCGREHFAQRRVRVTRQPTQRIDQFAMQQRRDVEHRERRLRFARARIDGTDVRDDTDEFARTEGHAHARAHLHAVDIHAVGRAIVEQSRQRQRQGHTQDGVVGGHRVQSKRAMRWT